MHLTKLGFKKINVGDYGLDPADYKDINVGTGNKKDFRKAFLSQPQPRFFFGIAEKMRRLQLKMQYPNAGPVRKWLNERTVRKMMDEVLDGAAVNTGGTIDFDRKRLLIFLCSRR